MKEIGKEELKRIQLDILLSIHRFCEDKGLRYSLSSGSLLGAVRHKGYIPWDDDIDIMMPRPDYEKFRRLYNGFNPYHTVQSYHNDDSYWFNYLKVYDNRTLFVEGASRNGVFVDVFVIDGLPQATQDLMKLKEDATQLVNRELRWVTKEYKSRTKSSEKFINFIKYIIRSHLVDSRSIIVKKLDDLFMQNSFDDSSLAGAFFFDRFFGVLPKQIYDNYTLIQFEGHMLKCVQDTHTYLECLYGDYMKLPPENERIGRHHIHAYWI